MKRLCFVFMWVCFVCVLSCAHPINHYKYILLECQDEVPEDVEKRFLKEFPKLGFIMVNDDAYSELDSENKALTLTAQYKLRGSNTTLMILKLVSHDGNIVYDDLQIGEGVMSAKNDRQSAITQLFRELKKLDYHFEAK